MSKSDYSEGFSAGFAAAYEILMKQPYDFEANVAPSPGRPLGSKKSYRKGRKQTGKAKILTAMTAPVWKKYKKGSGRKTYVQIRAQVSRSQAYKRKVKNL